MAPVSQVWATRDPRVEPDARADDVGTVHESGRGGTSVRISALDGGGQEARDVVAYAADRITGAG